MTTDAPSPGGASTACCAAHPDSPALGACARCGRFVCDGCATEREPLLCAGCTAVVDDPLGLRAHAFKPIAAITRGVRLVFQTPAVLLVSLAFSLPPALLSFAGKDSPWSLLERPWDFFVNSIGEVAILALLVARAEGRRLTLGSALQEATARWGRMLLATFLSGLYVVLFTLLLVVPGVVKAVQLAFVTVAVLRTSDDALAYSARLVEGRWLRVFGFYLLIGLFVGLPLLGLLGGVGFIYAAVELPEPLIDAVATLLAALLVNGVIPAMTLVAFYGLHQETGVPLEPMRWTTAPPRALAPPSPSPASAG